MNIFNNKQTQKREFNRIQILRVGLMLVGFLLIARLFYVQVVRHDYYQAQALAEHIKKFEISAPRGLIKIQDGDHTVPLVLNEPRYTIYADPKYITDAEETAGKLIDIIGGKKPELTAKLKDDKSRYVVIAKKMSKSQADKIENMKLKGIGKKEIMTRVYPQGNLASQVLGFVNDDGKGQYGIEEYLNSKLSGKPGLEKAITDIRGIPLAINNDNILEQAQPGEDLVLTIDMSMQKIVEEMLKNGVERTKSVRGSAIIMEAKTGAIKAMANFPTYDPTKYDKITDQSVFMNTAVSLPWEPGSVMKPLTVSASMNEGKSTPETSFFDPGYVTIGDRTITDSTNWGAQTMTIRDVLNKSLNTGAVFTLKTLGDGNINEQARTTWYKYLKDHYYFGKKTGIEQSGEADGYVAKPSGADGLEVRYANMSFGQGITLTPIQLVAAYASIVNGGIYYKPTLVAQANKNNDVLPQKGTVVNQNVISPAISNQIKEMLKNSLEINNKAAVRGGFTLGAKSGTAQVADSNGNYRTDVYNGSYVGYIGDADGPKYIMIVRLDEPKTPGFASAEAYKLWDEISNKLIDIISLKPIGQ